jgi:hypothetical protein
MKFYFFSFHWFNFYFCHNSYLSLHLYYTILLLECQQVLALFYNHIG